METEAKLKSICVGLSLPYSDLSYIYKQLEYQGVVFTFDLHQLMARGIPIIAELNKVLDWPKEPIIQLAGQGKISFEHVDKAITNLTSEDGVFYGLDQYYDKIFVNKF